MSDDDLDALLGALSNQARRRMLDLLMAAPGQTLSALASHFEMSRIGVLKHVDVLESAGLVHSTRVGRERRLTADPTPLQLLLDRFSDRYGAFWSGHLANIKARVERDAAAARDENRA